jgi:hypothetical protein
MFYVRFICVRVCVRALACVHTCSDSHTVSIILYFGNNKCNTS